jgi:hypothetical protein
MGSLLKHSHVPLPLATVWLATLLEILDGGSVCPHRNYYDDRFDVGRDVYRKHQLRL